LRVHAVRWLVWAPSLFGLWLLLAADWTRVEAAAAACAAVVAATAMEVAIARAGLRVRVSRAALVAAASAPAQVVADFAIITAALARGLAHRERVHGSFQVRPLPASGRGRRGGPARAWLTIIATYSPNAYVVDVDDEHGTVLMHDLVPRRASERPM
jgi:hypothetical protein